LGKLRAKNRSTVSANRTSSGVSSYSLKINLLNCYVDLFLQDDYRESTARAASMVRSSSVRPR